MPIVWLSVAVQDVLQIRTFIADQDPQSALNHLAKMPKMGRPGRIFGTRELAISGTPLFGDLSCARGSCGDSTGFAWSATFAGVHLSEAHSHYSLG